VSLPPILLRAPSFFFAGAVLFFLASCVLSVFELNSSMGYVDRDNPMFRLGLLRAVLQAAEGAAYLAAYGVLIRVLLAIWGHGRAISRSGVDE